MSHVKDFLLGKLLTDLWLQRSSEVFHCVLLCITEKDSSFQAAVSSCVLIYPQCFLGIDHVLLQNSTPSLELNAWRKDP